MIYDYAICADCRAHGPYNNEPACPFCGGALRDYSQGSNEPAAPPDARRWSARSAPSARVAIPTHPRLPHLALCLQAAEVVLSQPNRGAAAILSTLIGASTGADDTWDLDRARTAMALLVGAAGYPPDERVEPRAQAAIYVLRLVLATGARGADEHRWKIARLVFGESLTDEALPLLDWLTEAPPIPAKTLRRRAKLAARATLTHDQGSP